MTNDEINQLIATEIMGATINEYKAYGKVNFKPATDIKIALKSIEKFIGVDFGEKVYSAEYEPGAAMAICKSLLKAKGIEVGE